MSKLTKGIAIAGLLSPVGAQALGVGEIRLQSYLNQPLRAEIPLVLSQEKLSDIKIQLAPAKDFSAAGLERPHVLTKLRFDPAPTANGGFVIRVGSSQIIQEPFLSFLVELTWPEGRMLRNFTVLLDPPDVLAHPGVPQRPLETVSANEAGSAPGYQPPSPGPTSMVAAAVFPAESQAAEYGPVGRNEKLWTIAENLNRDASITQEQMVIALFRANPRAFSRPNVNALNAGAMLKIPAREYILQISPSLAKEEFYRHQSGRTPRWMRNPVAANSLPSENPDPPVETKPARVSEPPVQAVRNVRAAPSVQGEDGLRAVQALQQENSEMRARLAELENRVAELRAMVGERKTPAASGPPPSTPATKATTESDQARPQGELVAPARAQTTPKITEAGNADVTPATEAAMLPSAAGKIPVTTPPPPPVQHTPEQQAAGNAVPAGTSEPRPADSAVKSLAAATIQQGPQEHPLLWSLAGAAAAALASLLGVYYLRRSRATTSAAEPTQPEKVPAAPGNLGSAAVTPGDNNPAHAVHEGEASRLKSDSEEVDPIFEADIYLSYGKHSQAIETVESAIRKHPEREAYRLKLLEILLVRGDTQRFETEVVHLKASDAFADSDFWNQMYELSARLHAEDLLNKAIGRNTTIAAAAAPVDSAPQGDETDRLIDDLKRFSLEIRDEASKAPPNAETQDRAPLPGTPEQVAEVSSDDLHHIQWAPSQPDAKPTAANSDAIEASFNAAADADHLIEFAPASPPDEARPQTLEDMASESIDSLLKELSAMHYERHFTEDDAAEAANPTKPPAERSNAKPAASDAESAGKDAAAAGSTDSRPSMDEDGSPAADLETKLDLARAYADMGDYEQAREFLNEVIDRGSELQKTEAAGLLVTMTRA